MFSESQKRFDPKQTFHGYKAYQGGKSIKTPKNKPINKELTIEDKQKNKKLASERIFVEHLIRLVKIFKVV